MAIVGYWRFNGNANDASGNGYNGTAGNCVGTDTRFDITKVGNTCRYTYDGTGLSPFYTATYPGVGVTVVISGQNFNAANNGTFTTTASNTNYFEITNAAGVAESNKTIGTGYIYVNNYTPVKYNQSSGILDGGVSFDGNANSVSTPGLGVAKNADKTWSAWIRINEDFTGADKYKGMFSWYVNQTVNAFGYWRVSGANMFICDRGRVGTANDYLQFDNPTVAHGFYHLVGTITDTGATLTFYVDGKYISSKTVNTGDGATDAGLLCVVGANNIRNNWTNISVDELKCDNTCWTAAKVKDEYSRVKGFF